MFGLGPFEIVVIGAIAVMLYGKRLPEVGRSAGKTLGELRRQWTTLAKELDVAAHIEGRSPRPAVARRSASDEADAHQVAAPRFDPPPASDTPA
jgi:sec-independent protein translocase protein TatA